MKKILACVVTALLALMTFNCFVLAQNEQTYNVTIVIKDISTSHSVGPYYTLPPAPVISDSDWEFAGWKPSTSEEPLRALDTYKLENDITFTAVFNKKNTVTFTPEYSLIPGTSGNTGSLQQDSITNVCTLTPYTSFAGLGCDFSSLSTADFTINYITIKYNYFGAMENTKMKIVILGETEADNIEITAANYLRKPKEEETGWTFAVFKIDENITKDDLAKSVILQPYGGNVPQNTKDNKDIIQLSEITFSEKAPDMTYDIRYVEGDVITTVSHKVGSEYTLAEPVKEAPDEMIFNGWKIENSNDSDPFKSGQSASADSEVTYVAVYSERKPQEFDNFIFSIPTPEKGSEVVANNATIEIANTIPDTENTAAQSLKITPDASEVNTSLIIDAVPDTAVREELSSYKNLKIKYYVEGEVAENSVFSASITGNETQSEVVTATCDNIKAGEWNEAVFSFENVTSVDKITLNLFAGEAVEKIKAVYISDLEFFNRYSVTYKANADEEGPTESAELFMVFGENTPLLELPSYSSEMPENTKFYGWNINGKTYSPNDTYGNAEDEKITADIQITADVQTYGDSYIINQLSDTSKYVNNFMAREFVLPNNDGSADANFTPETKIDLDIYKYMAIIYCTDNEAAKDLKFTVNPNFSAIADSEESENATFESNVLSDGGWKLAVVDFSTAGTEGFDGRISELNLGMAYADDAAASKDNVAVNVSKIIFCKEMPTDIHEHDNYINGFDDNSFKPNAQITRSQACAIVARIVAKQSGKPILETYENPFNDTENHWARNEIAYLKNLDFLNNYLDTFDPDAKITRLEFVSLINNILTKDQKNVSIDDITLFTDINDEVYTWQKNAVKVAIANKIITGYEDGSFKPDNEISRAEVVTVVNRALGRDTTNILLLNNDLLDSANYKFTDDEELTWARQNIYEASIPHIEIILGEKTEDGKNNSHWLPYEEDTSAKGEQ